MEYKDYRVHVYDTNDESKGPKLIKRFRTGDLKEAQEWINEYVRNTEYYEILQRMSRNKP